MDKIVIAIVDDIKNKEKFDSVLNSFEKQGNQIHVFEGITKEKFDIEIILHLINSIEIEIKQTRSITVISNIRDIINLWYRCYNTLVDNFVYFSEGKGSFFCESDDLLEKFMYNMSKFVGIENEDLYGKIYAVNTGNVYNDDYKFIINNLKYYDTYENFEYNKTTGLSNERIYRFEGYDFNFSSDGKTDNVDYINVQSDFKDEKKFELGILFENEWFVPYFLISEITSCDRNKRNLIVALFRKLSGSKKDRIINAIFIQLNNINKFEHRIVLISFAITLGYKDKIVMNEFMKTLFRYCEDFSMRYEGLVQSLFYRSTLLIDINDDYYKNGSEIISLLANDIKSLNGLYHKSENRRNSIAVVVDQLLKITHSPTKVILDYCKMIKKLFPDYNIKFFVEDNMLCKEFINISCSCFSSTKSSLVRNEHEEYLNEYELDIYYADTSMNKKRQVFETVNKIFEFNPDIIFTTSQISISNRVLDEYFPIVYLSMGGEYFLNRADYYLCGNKGDVLKWNEKLKLIDNHKIVDFNYGINLEKSKEKIDLEYKEIFNGDFIMVTVGNRIATEMSKKFIDGICTFLKNIEKIKWLIVGSLKVPYISETYEDLINNGKIVFIDFESRLSSLYNSCDVYINPRRYSGGISIAMAMNQGLPVAIFNEMSDGLMYVGEDNGCGDSMDEYIDFLRKLYMDKDYKESIGIKMERRIESFTLNSSVESLMSIFNDSLKSKKLEFKDKSNFEENVILDVTKNILEPEKYKNTQGRDIFGYPSKELYKAAMYYDHYSSTLNFEKAESILEEIHKSVHIEKYAMKFKKALFERIKEIEFLKDEVSLKEIAIKMFSKFLNEDYGVIANIVENSDKVYKETWEKIVEDEDNVTEKQLYEFYNSIKFPVGCMFPNRVDSSLSLAYSAIVMELIDINKSKKVFDFGGNTGEVLSAISKGCDIAECFLIEENETALEFAIWKDETLGVKNMYYLKESDLSYNEHNYFEYFDFGICTEVLEHVYDVEGTVERISKLLRKEGLLFCSASFGLYPTPSHLKKNIKYSGRERELFEKYGFIEVDINPSIPILRNMKLYIKQ